MELLRLASAAEHRRAHAGLARVFRAAGARRVTARLQEGTLPTLLLPSHELWLTAHALPNRYRNALGPGDPRGGLVWPSVQLNLPLAPGSARPHARFLRDHQGRTWVAHSGALGGRQKGISRAGFIAFLGRPLQQVTVEDVTEELVVLGSLDEPPALLDAIAELAHAAHAYRLSLR